MMSVSRPFARRPAARATHHGLMVFILLVSFCMMAWANTFQYTATHTTSKSPVEVWRIMTAYADTCDKGCKYYRPSLVKVQKLAFESTPTRWYTWTHVSSSVKDAKFFSEVTIDKRADGHFKTVNRQLDSGDKQIVATLESKTGLKHSPVFDSGSTTTHTRAEGKNTFITQTVTVHTGAVVGLWSNRIRDEMRKNVAATFANIGR